MPHVTGQLHTADRWVGMAAQEEAAMGSGDERRLREVVGQLTTEAGYDLEELAVRSAGRRRVVRVVIDADGGVTLDAAAEISRAISERLDESVTTIPPALRRTPSRSPAPASAGRSPCPDTSAAPGPGWWPWSPRRRPVDHRAGARHHRRRACSWCCPDARASPRRRCRSPRSPGPRSRSSSARRPPRCRGRLGVAAPPEPDADEIADDDRVRPTDDDDRQMTRPTTTNRRRRTRRHRRPTTPRRADERRGSHR